MIDYERLIDLDSRRPGHIDNIEGNVVNVIT